MEYSVLCLLLCLTTSKDVSGQTIVASLNHAAVNSNVTLQVYPETSIQGGMWFHGSTFIMQWYPMGSFPNPTWASRITFNSTLLALSIRSVQVADSGIYLIQGPSIELNVILSVQEPISNAILRADATDLVELNDTAVFTCSVTTGSSLSYLWLNGSSEVNASLVQLTNGGSTVSIPMVTRYDTGPFRCNVSNGISHDMVRQSISLNISYGPDTPVIMGPWLNLTSQNVTLTCTASSQPPSTYTWLFNGSQVATGSVYESGPLTSHNNEEFTCVAFNNITNKNSTASQKLTVIGNSVVPLHSSAGLMLMVLVALFVPVVNDLWSH
ncbi:carcinoembryonic antigen-related cell adhesion molecule 8-like [Hypomesus transpacificus]|uniref:carcinoembryonic antigen-related cell adhesion molecule 8-like n=1 Tax=Hypomesus transpacificus TaxID=137520 RepID=UPI001F073942|nr:carcinoembryonic antigen-related cell adhesion molecule 8-like [Hypomesus transpacificus]